MRTWYVSAEGFRELRHSCLLSRQRCADYLGVSLRTVRYWEAGRNRVPWSVVRLLRLLRCGDLGGLEDGWAGWTINRHGLWSPDGRQFRPEAMRQWWITCQQARFWRQDYDRGRDRGVGRSPAQTLQPEAREAERQAAAALSHPIGAAPTLTALAVRMLPRAVREPAAAGMAGSLSGGAARLGLAAAARSAAGLVIFSTSGTRMARTLMQQGSRRVYGR